MSEEQADIAKDDSMDLLRMSEGELTEVFEQLDQMVGDGSDSFLSGSQRRPYREGRVSVQIQGMNDLAPTTFQMKPSDICRIGMSLLHGVFVYPGSACNITLRPLSGEAVEIPGEVATCRWVSGRVHEIGVKFAEPIELGDFIASKGAG